MRGTRIESNALLSILIMKNIRPKHATVTNYWHEYYCADHCTLCGNSGVIDTTGTRTAAGVLVGRKNYCICPNGQAMRVSEIPLDNRVIERQRKI